ncbi:MAG: hypothetical protein AVDCRST_MAG34-2679, partial [uncultured Nocardioidaceae bacterium]
DRAPPGRRRSAVRLDVPGVAPRRPSRHRDGLPVPAGAQGVPLRGGHVAGVGVVRADVLRARHRRTAARGEEHQLPGGPAGTSPGGARAGRAEDPRGAPRPGRQGGLQLAVQHRQRLRDASAGGGAGGEPGPVRAVGRREHVGVTIRIPGARSLRHDAGALACHVPLIDPHRPAGGAQGKPHRDRRALRRPRRGPFLRPRGHRPTGQREPCPDTSPARGVASPSVGILRRERRQTPCAARKGPAVGDDL